ncbi:septum formation family protein [Nakamurella deserti]|uniref:septum formation family protein n=1 Tax=Nakamurella deserti TaxID=2164074 RepID=UPI000DBE72F2|nr:septum formation family protein [Nakamurella deserti]
MAPTLTVQAPVRPAGGRRGLGVLILAAAVVLVLVASAALDRGVPGTPTARPLPPPPPVGSCLDLTRTSVSVVPCGAPHHAEVLQTWPAGTIPEGVGDFRSVAAYPFGGGGQVSTAGCAAAQTEWVHPADLPGAAFWNPTSPVVDSQLLAAPPSERTPTRGWAACILVAPDRQPVTGSLRGTDAAAPPSRLSSCVQAATNAWGPVTLTCDQPHRIEVLASFRIRSVFDEAQRFTGMPDDDTLAAACTDLAAAVTGASDPTFGGRLQVSAVSLFPASIREIDAVDPAGNAVRTYIPLPQCVVELFGEGTLTGTVVGLGAGALPLG